MRKAILDIQFWRAKMVFESLTDTPICACLNMLKRNLGGIDRLLEEIVHLTQPEPELVPILRAGLLLIVKESLNPVPTASSQEYTLLNICHRPASDAAIRLASSHIAEAALKRLQAYKGMYSGDFFNRMEATLGGLDAPLAIENIMISTKSGTAFAQRLLDLYPGVDVSGTMVTALSTSETLLRRILLKSRDLRMQMQSFRLLRSSIVNGQDAELKSRKHWQQNLACQFAGTSYDASVGRTIRLDKCAVRYLVNSEETLDKHTIKTVDELYGRYATTKVAAAHKEAIMVERPVFLEIAKTPIMFKRMFGVRSEEQVLQGAVDDYGWYEMRMELRPQDNAAGEERFLWDALKWSNCSAGIQVPNPED